MVDAEQLTLTLEVGGNPPDYATLRLSGALEVGADLLKGQVVQVQVVDEDGQMVATCEGYVTAVGFRTKTVRDVQLTERIHTVKLDV